MCNEIKLKIQKYTLVLITVLGILNAPGSVAKFITIISRKHRFVEAYYGTLTYSINMLEVCLIIWGLLIYRKRRESINILPILGLVLAKDFIIYLLGSRSPFSLNSWEMYIWPLIGVTTSFVICEYARSENNVYIFLDGIILINFVTQILLIISKRSELSGAEAIGQGHNSVGYIAAVHIIYGLLLREKNKKTISVTIIAFISILFSGSRFSLLIVFVGVFVFIPRIMKTVRKRYRYISSVALSVVIVLLVMMIANPNINSKYQIFEQASSIFNSTGIVNNIMGDQSFKERVESFTVGFRVIKDNPFGLSNSYIDVYLEMIQHGFFSFPHSTVLTFYMLWGPMFFVCIAWILIRMKKTNEKNMCYFLGFILCCLMFYGGLEISPKWYAYIFCLLSAIRMREKKMVK